MSAPEHEKLLAYKRALEVAGCAELVIREIPPHHHDLRDQMRRASTSVVLNLAEGAAEFRPAEKARLYRIALRSGAECQAVLDVLKAVGVECSEAPRMHSLLRETCALTTRLIHAVEARA